MTSPRVHDDSWTDRRTPSRSGKVRRTRRKLNGLWDPEPGGRIDKREKKTVGRERTDREADGGQTEKRTLGGTDRHADRQTCRQTDMQTDMQTNERKMDSQADDKRRRKSRHKRPGGERALRKCGRRSMPEKAAKRVEERTNRPIDGELTDWWTYKQTTEEPDHIFLITVN